MSATESIAADHLDLTAVQDVIYAISATRKQNAASAIETPPVLSAQQRAKIMSSSRARAWIPAHLLDSLR